jgi:hypothetical protein
MPPRPSRLPRRGERARATPTPPGLKTGIAKGRRHGERAGTVAGRRVGQAKLNGGQSLSPPANASPPATPPPDTAPTDPPTSPSTGDWPAYTVFIASKATQSEAQAFVDRADAQGFSGSGILYSSDYASLHPGYWVAYIGTYDTKSNAQATMSDVHSAGFSDAYVSYVSQGE